MIAYQKTANRVLKTDLRRLLRPLSAVVSPNPFPLPRFALRFFLPRNIR